MGHQFYRTGKGTSKLAKNFGKAAVNIALDTDVDNVWGRYKKKKDIALSWYITAEDEDYPIYQGIALVRAGKVHFYDRYPCGGGPFKVSEFEDPDFRKRAELIAKNIESLLREE